MQATIDMISRLSDDVLLIIIGFLPTARDVVRTSALSRRWRHLWTLAPTLRFVFRPKATTTNKLIRPDATAADRLAVIVDSILTRRANGPDVKDLKISFAYNAQCRRFLFERVYHTTNITRERIATWLHFAKHRVAGAFTLELPMRSLLRAQLVADLPCSEKLETIHLKLGGVILRVPKVAVAGTLLSLSDVMLGHTNLKNGDDVRLDWLFSLSCCPQLQRLQLNDIDGLTHLCLDAANTLEELRLYNLRNIQRMQVNAPGLRKLIILNVSLDLLAEATEISTPSLQALTCDNPCKGGGQMVLDGTPNTNLSVLSHGVLEEDDNRAVAWFLQHCIAADRLDVELKIEFDATIDMISRLSDDVLLIIIGFLPAARDVVQTSALSRRWRHLWTLAPTLRFVFKHEATTNNQRVRPDVTAVDRLAVVVDSILMRRVNGPDVKDLNISFIHNVECRRFLFVHVYRTTKITRARIATWLHFAKHHVSWAFTLELLMRSLLRAQLVADFPCSEKLETIHLRLGGAILRVPKVVVASTLLSLTDVLLGHTNIKNGDDIRLGWLFSLSCCPQLQRLQLNDIDGLTHLCLDAANTLEELRLNNLRNIQWMQVNAPGLRKLVILNVSLDLLAEATEISTPSLQALTCDNPCKGGGQMVLDGTHNTKLCVLSHGVPGEDDNRAVAWFLQQCAAADRLDVELKIELDKVKLQAGIEDVMKDIPELPNITDLRITVTVSNGTMDTHTIGASVAKLIAKCIRIKYLSIDMSEKADDCFDLECKCDQPEGWNNLMISLEHLRIANIHNFLSSNDQIELICTLLSNAPALERMTVALHKSYGEAYLNIPCCGGRWTPCARERRGSNLGIATKYEWKPCKRRRGE
uniref:F-box domain-containing protein n=1 Tax=Leersia perrieri TaxID=77586 RepID=A0A0D9XY99_9ORYZ